MPLRNASRFAVIQSEGPDSLLGTAGDDTLAGAGGNDTLDGGAGNDLLLGGDHDDWLLARAGNDTLDGGAGDDVLVAGALDTVMRLTGGLGADAFDLRLEYGNLFSDGSSVAYATRISDFDQAAGDRLVSGVADGEWDHLQLLWRGQAAAGFTGAIGQSLALAGSGPDNTQHELWTFFDAALGRTVVFLDRNHDFTVDANDLRIEFEGDVALDAGAFSAGTFVALAGTTGADTDAGTGLGAGSDIAFALGGDDTLDGLAGDDTLQGDTGNDRISGGDGIDSLWGNLGNDWLSAGTGGGHLFGGGGSDTLRGGTGADVLLADDTTNDHAYAFQLSFDAAATLNHLYGGDGNDSLQGGLGADRLYGEADDDVLAGHAGNDILDAGDGADVAEGGDGHDSALGGQGADTLAGGAGRDTLRGGDGADVVYAGHDGVAPPSEAAGDGNLLFGDAGNDTLVGAANADRLDGGFDADDLAGNGGADTLIGRAGDDVLAGGDGDDSLDGGDGDDAIDGGDGDDRIAFDAADLAVVDGGAGRDTLVVAGVLAVDLATADQVAGGGLTTGFENVDAWAALAALAISGNDIANSLLGGSGADTILALGGADVLDGRGGADSMDGGDGDDTYFVNAAGDVVVEANADLATGGNDIVMSGIGMYTLAANVEHLRLTSTGAANGTGNALDNTIYAGAGNNVLNGAGGNDTVSYRFAAGGVTASLALATAQATGGSGSDTLLNIDNLVGSDFADVFTGTDYANRLAGGLGNDLLEAAGGHDTLLGESGDDTLAGGNGNDRIDGGAGLDTATYAASGAGITASLAIATQQATGQGTDQLLGIENLIGSAFGDALSGNSLANRLTGGSGDDLLAGGLANDSLFGNDGHDTLDGGTGTDYLAGGLGDDAYVVDSAADVVVEAAGGGTDTVHTSVTMTLGANIENARMLGGFIGVTGNALDNHVWLSDDSWYFNGGGGNDTIDYSYLTHSVQVSLTSLSSVENAVGTDFVDQLTGNSLANALSGGGGIDRLTGLGGADTLTGGSGADQFIYSGFYGSAEDPSQWDTITDFSSADGDVIDLRALGRWTFIGDADFSANATLQVRYDSATGVVQGSWDADAAAEIVIILTGAPSLTAADFVI